MRNDDAYGGEAGDEDVDVDYDRMRDLGVLPFWLGDDDGEMRDCEEWTQDELEMRQLIGEGMSNSFCTT